MARCRRFSAAPPTAASRAAVPVIRDRLFFFGAIDPQQVVRTMQAPDGFPLQTLGSVDRVRRSVSYAAKATARLGNGQRLDASFFGDPSRGVMGPTAGGGAEGGGFFVVQRD